MQAKASNKIFLIRHARPDVSKAGWFSAKTAQQFITDYDTAAAVENFVLEHVAIPFRQISKVYCSTLVRSQLTAKAIFGEEVEVEINPAFREFERRIFRLPWLRLPIRFWLFSARMLWFMGFNSKGIETFAQARQRAQECTHILTREARENKVAVLVGHGLLNFYISKALKKEGWRQTARGGSGFLSVNVLEK